jgi:hypothetical protein
MSLNAKNQIDEVEDAYTHWVQAKRDKDIIMQQM